MHFSFTEEQALLRNSVQTYLRDHYAFETRRAVARSPLGMRREIWKAFAEELGILSLCLPERLGGFASDPVATMIVMEEFGRALVVEPFQESVVLCGALFAHSGGTRTDECLQKIASGLQIPTLAWSEQQSRYDFSRIGTTARREGSRWRIDGVKCAVTAAPWATQFLVSARTSGTAGDRGGLSLFLLERDAAGVTTTEYPAIDERRAGDLALEAVYADGDALIGAEGRAFDVIEAASDAATTALCAEAVGVLSVMHQFTLDYTKQRRQFGQPIASFQVVQHRMVDMYMQVEMAQSAVYLATLKLAAPPVERALAVSAAKVTVNQACRFVGQNAIQLHGGMGMTDELAISHYFKRATAIEIEFGSTDFHLQRHARLMRTVDEHAGGE